jgi:ABC-type polysaccharide/polyol phosphate transport system ATPase subunit
VTEPAIALRDVTKLYRRYAYRRQFSTLKSALLKGSLASELEPREVLRAVDGVSLDVARGRTVGLIGRNGSGKSTLLKLVAGITKPTSGTVAVRGRISALIELGAGFHPEISGRENIFINGVMLGLTKREIAERFDEIVEFAEIEDFIDSPVKTYSSGMYMRLGFAVAVHVDPDVLLIDEVLAVGDEGFSLKCLDKFADFKRRGKTIVLVTHGLNLVERYCDEAVWVDAGHIRGHGDPRHVVHAYTTDVAKSEEHVLASEDRKAQAAVGVDRDTPRAVDEQPATTHEDPPADMFRAAQGRWGAGPLRIERVSLERDGTEAHVFRSGDRLAIRLAVRTSEPVQDFVFGISIFNSEGVCCYGTNTDIEEFEPVELSGTGEVLFVIDRLDLVEGTYKLDVAAHTRHGVQYDYHRLLYTFRVKSHTKDAGIYRPRHSWWFSPAVRLTPRRT